MSLLILVLFACGPAPERAEDTDMTGLSSLTSSSTQRTTTTPSAERDDLWVYFTGIDSPPVKYTAAKWRLDPPAE